MKIFLVFFNCADRMPALAAKFKSRSVKLHSKPYKNETELRTQNSELRTQDSEPRPLNIRKLATSGLFTRRKFLGTGAVAGGAAAISLHGLRLDANALITSTWTSGTVTHFAYHLTKHVKRISPWSEGGAPATGEADTLPNARNRAGAADAFPESGTAEQFWNLNTGADQDDLQNGEPKCERGHVIPTPQYDGWGADAREYQYLQTNGLFSDNTSAPGVKRPYEARVQHVQNAVKHWHNHYHMSGSNIGCVPASQNPTGEPA